MLKYGFVLLSGYVVFLSLEADRNMTPPSFALSLFWILRGKFGYPSHVLFAFIPAILIGRHLTGEYLALGIACFAVYGVLEYAIRRFKGWIIQVLLYWSLARFLVVPFGLGLYLNDFNPLWYTIPSLLSMHVVRYLIRKDFICIREGIRT